jgi:ABC-type uncharacterized transport system permease subunit
MELAFHNLSFGWLWIHLGIVSGMALGTSFLRPGFLGGYASPRRRLVRLGHISFIGLGGINVLFALSVPEIAAPGMQIASASLVVAAVSMPLACFAVAWRQVFFPLFCVPVSAALLSTGLIAWEFLT